MRDVRAELTAYLPRVGALADDPIVQTNNNEADVVPESEISVEEEKAAAARAIQSSTRPDAAFLLRILNGLRRL
jgi:hypothetical protein